MGSTQTQYKPSENQLAEVSQGFTVFAFDLCPLSLDRFEWYARCLVLDQSTARSMGCCQCVFCFSTSAVVSLSIVNAVASCQQDVQEERPCEQCGPRRMNSQTFSVSPQEPCMWQMLACSLMPAGCRFARHFQEPCCIRILEARSAVQVAEWGLHPRE